jgi:hypothetical protein
MNTAKGKCTHTIRYSAERVAKLVEFSLFGPKPRIQSATGESLRTLRAVATQRQLPPASVLSYFELQPDGKNSYTWNLR